MEENKDKKKGAKVVHLLFIVLFIVFLTIYISSYTGYNEYELHKKVVLTDEMIAKFESDVKNNKNINIEDYYDTNYKNYNNKTSKFGLKISQQTGDIVRHGIEIVFNKLNRLIED